MRPVTNILILGETGIGKSTFINGLVNYLHYDTLEDAENDQLHVLIESWITHYNEDGSSRKIAIRPTGIPQYGQSNEHTMVGQSSTQDPMDYIFEYNCGKVKRVVRIIDTPGIGDTRGIEQDSLNYEKILQFLCGIDKIDAIMILMKPNCARLTLMFQFCVDELLVHLHKHAAKNVFFCFTNASASQFTPGESLPALREHLSKLDLDKIQLNLGEESERFFCFDNESFRYLTARNHGAKFPVNRTSNLRRKLEKKSSQQAIRLFERIAATQPHDVELTLNLNNSRAAIFRVTEPLADLAQAQLINERVINEKIKEVEDCDNSEDEDEMDLSVERTVYKKNPTQLPQMVCMAPCCVDNVKLRPEETRTTPVPKRACHADCPTQGIIPETFPNPGIQQCEIIDLSTLQCRVCGCSWSIHTHLMYTYEKTTEKYVDPRVLEMEQKEGKTKETRELFVQTLKAELTAQSAKKQEIMNVVGGKVSEFLKDCIVSHNAAYGDYLNLEIKTERDKEQSERVPGYLDRLNKLKGRFDAQVELIKNCSKEPRKSLKTFDEIIMELGLASDDSTVLKPKPTPPFSGASITVKRTPPLPKRVIFGINP
ncbi:unnamed protein product [Caenorhabditis auriculariae]|uniref:DUF8206 domain-containing protein n=1 Tax=Caenorhabditis auriculariae TaxID=2777116 RepID=A0A8S1HZL5_9PELO|nr:unnamed protein product [Caenorhabditis auriculariae]